MLKRQIATTPTRAGVYFFRDARGTPLYIGKAANLKTRLRSYFRSAPSHAPAIRAMLRKAVRVTWQETNNEIEALIVEAQLIKRHHPFYNVLLRDDKNYFYVGFTHEEFPRIFITHQPNTGSQGRGVGHQSFYVGPFTEGNSLRRTLRLLRRVFPYVTHQGLPKRCLEYEMGLCPLPPARSEFRIPARGEARHRRQNSEFRNSYRRNIRAIREILTGKRTRLAKRFQGEMRNAVKRKDFETAARLRDEIRGLERIFAHRNVIAGRETMSEIPTPIHHMLSVRGQSPHGLIRIEGYDIANLAQGKAAAGSMVVFVNGKPDASQYRQFRIKTVKGANDVAMLTEVLKRRFSHPEWPAPTLILIDGGRAQLNAASTALRHQLPVMPIVTALAKRNEEIFLPNRSAPLRLPKSDPFLQLLMRVRDEAHRFARRYHHRLLDKNIRM